MSTKHLCLLREKSPNPLKEILTNFKAEYSAKITKGKTKMIENRKRNIQVKFRVDEKEYECILKKVQLSGKRNMASYLRYMAITGRIMNIELEDLKITSANVGRITSSLNQIAKRINATGNIYDEDIADMKDKVDKVWQELKSIRLALRSISQ